MSAADPVFTRSDLESWSREGTSLAVLGHPIKHSISPAMHNAALAALARDAARFLDWKYFRFELRPEDLPLLRRYLVILRKYGYEARCQELEKRVRVLEAPPALTPPLTPATAPAP